MASAAEGNEGEKDRNPIIRAVTVLSAVIGLFVTLNTALESCTQQRIEKARTQREAVRFEEQYWSQLYSRFLNASGSREMDSAERRAELMSIAFLSLRENPTFSEYDGDTLFGSDLAADRQHLDELRDVLQSALRKYADYNPQIGEDILLVLDDATNTRAREGEEGGEATAGEMVPPPVTNVQKQQTIAIQQAQGPVGLGAPVSGPASELAPQVGSTVLATGADNGWDIDVFWCDGGTNRVSNYNEAVRLGDLLARTATRGTLVDNSYKLGRIRVRSLSQTAQETGRYATSGNWVVYDSGAGEEDAARALAEQVSGREGLPSLGVKYSRGAVTPWYLSAFVCS